MNIGHEFSNPKLLETALTHSSWVHENAGTDNERLEFLGDAVLNMCTTLLIFERFPDAPEGQLTRLRSKLVNTTNLAAIGRELELGQRIKLGRGEETTGGRDKDRILENTVEAVLGAVYLDSDVAHCRQVVANWMEPRLAILGTAGEDAWKDSRSLLQERTQAAWQKTPSYVVTGQAGPPHAPTFDVEVRAGTRLLGTGQGGSKREASKRAAADALLKLQSEIKS